MTRLNDVVSAPSTLMPPGQVVERGRGCWNCIHWDPDKGKAHWNVRRQGLLTLAVQHRHLGDEKKAKGLAMMVDKTDAAVARDSFGLCGKGWMPDDCKDPQPLVHYQNLCHNWSGRDGSSLATQGHPIDLLPEELREEFHPKVDPKLVAKAKAAGPSVQLEQPREVLQINRVTAAVMGEPAQEPVAPSPILILPPDLEK